MKPKHADKTASQRQLRVGESLRHTLTDIMRRSHFRDPDLQDVNVSIMEVRVSPDLKQATAYILPLAADAESTRKTVAALNRASGYMRSELAKEVELRVTPALKFEADTSLDYAKRIDELLKVHVPGDE
jgi:ribosome-binding factor A